MEVPVLARLRALGTVALRATALHHPPRPFLGWTYHTRTLPPGVRARHCGPPVEGPGGAYRLGRRVAAVLAGALLVAVCVPRMLLAQTPTAPPRVPPPLAGSVAVTPDDSAITLVPGSSGVARYFTVKNNFNVQQTYTMTCHASGVVTSCTPDAGSLTLPAFGSVSDFGVTFNISSSTGTGQVSLKAVGSASDTGWYAVTAAHPSGPTLTQPRQPDSVVNRAHCVASAAGIADWSCGDALFLLSTPSYTTLDRARSLTLTYASSTASPQPLVSANVALASEPSLDRITAVLTVHDTVRTTVTYAPWITGVRQLVLGWNAATAPSGAYPYTLTIYAVAGTDSASSSVSGILSVVNRSTGPYGAGWEWLGVERLVLHQPVGSGLANILWVDGDGSSKLYHQVNSTTWVAPAEAYRDTITLASGEYTRTLRHGVQVIFDSTGRHARTSNRQTQVTRFFWRSATQLDSVRVPPAGSGGKTFVLHYSGSSLLDSVRVGGRDIGVSVSSGNLTQWRWPDTTSLTFHTNSNGKIDSTTDGRGGKTWLHYGATALVDTAKVLYDSASVHLAAVTVFRPWQSVGYAGPVAGDTATAFTSIVGPRGVGDSVQFHVDKWGAPITVFNADHQTTRYVRGDANVPALITGIHFPNGRRDTLAYNSRGNLLVWADTSGDTGTFKGQRQSWAYADTFDIDSPSQAIGTDTTISQFTYNTLGLTATMLDPRHHLTTYAYVGSGAAKGTLASVTDDNVLVWIEAAQTDSLRTLVTTLTRDSSGNVLTVQNPAGGKTKYQRDAMTGLVTRVDNAVGLRTQYGYDRMDRMTRQSVLFAAGDASNGCVNQREFVCGDSAIVGALNPVGDSAVTTRTYTSGLLSRVTDPRGVKRSYSYDLRGLLVAEFDEAGRPDSTFYDASGLMTQQVNRNRKILTYRYDAAGRDTLWIMPAQGTFMYDSTHTAAADTVRSKFDSLGNLLVRSNRLGSIVRTYGNSGVPLTEARHPAPSGPHLVADSVQMAYDRFGRLDTLRWVGDAVHYRYASTGDLEEIFTDWKDGGTVHHDSVGFHWDSLGRRQRVTYKFNSMAATSHFDRLGTVRRLMVANSAPAAGNRFIDSLVADKVDLLGRPLHQRIVCPGMTSSDAGNPCGEWRPAEDTTKYNRPGQVVVQSLMGTTHWTTDTFNYDRSGNRSYHAHRDITSVVSTFTYPDSSNRVAVERDSIAGGSGTSNRHFVTDSLGARRFDLTIDAPADTFVLKIYQYDAAGRLMGTAIGSHAHPPLTIVSPNICAYDADTRSVQPCGGGAVTLLGDQVIHDPNGNWFYVYAPGIDEPILAIRRNPVDTTELARLDMVSNGNGQVVAIADSAGQLNAIYAQAIPGSNGGPWGSGLTSRGQTFDPRRWATAIGGDTISTFRTRQYDPATGKWLQEDPIGTAGGVNLYQYNGNDPNTFSDPFGLAPDTLASITVQQQNDDTKRATRKLCVDKSVSETVQAINDEAVAAGVPVVFTTAYRDRETAASPGRIAAGSQSQHLSGFAFDIKTSTLGGTDIDRFTAIAAKHGFSATGRDPGHYQATGREIATYGNHRDAVAEARRSYSARECTDAYVEHIRGHN